MMKKRAGILAALLAAALILTGCGRTAAPTATEKPGTPDEPKTTEAPAVEETPVVSTEFVPQLDTEKAVELDAAVFFGNFEAFDQVINHFNEFYPNVTITYESVGDSSGDFLKQNPQYDIFMTSTARGYDPEGCVDLLAAGVDFSAVADGMLRSNTVDGKVLALPMGLTLKGIAVNKTLLENEGLSVPETYPEFLSVLEALKQKGYTPLQGPATAVDNLFYDMAMAEMGENPALLEAALAGDAEGCAALKTVYERVQELLDQGYISREVAAEYPDNNYDGAILKFFEGDVPFWFCDTEKVSGMKKRESKSEAFSAEPFEYTFLFAPTGENGAYEYIEPWYGFAVNRESEDSDYAVEFLRFMARTDELNTLASLKGVPSIAKSSADERYAALGQTRAELSVVSDGTVPAYIGTLLTNTLNGLMSGEYADVDTAFAAFVEKCAESVA